MTAELISQTIPAPEQSTSPRIGTPPQNRPERGPARSAGFVLLKMEQSVNVSLHFLFL